MILVHADNLTHARAIGLSQGWRETQWDLFQLQRVRGLSEPTIVTCECVGMDSAWLDYLATTRAVIITIVCPRCKNAPR